MTWASILASALQFLKALADYLKANRLIELGRLREREANAQSNRDLAARIRDVDGSEVSDSEAFGPDNDLPGTGKE